MAGFGAIDTAKEKEKAITQALRDAEKKHGLSPIDAARSLRTSNQQRWDTQYLRREKVVIEEENLFLDGGKNKRPEGDFSITEWDNEGNGAISGKIWMASSRFWAVTLNDEGHKHFDWAINLWNGDTYSVMPAHVYREITNNLGIDAYNTYKETIMGDEDVLRKLLNACVAELKAKNKLAMSFVSSESSYRLLDRLGITHRQEWGFLTKWDKF